MCLSESSKLEKRLQKVNESLTVIELKLISESSTNSADRDTLDLENSEISSSCQELMTIVTNLKESFNTIQEKMSMLTTSDQDNYRKVANTIEATMSVCPDGMPIDR